MCLRHHSRARNWTFDENHFFGFFLKFLLKRIFWWKPCEKIQWRSWHKMPSKLLGCIGFLYKVVHNTGRFSVFIFPNFFPFYLSNGQCLGLEIWHTSSQWSFLQYLVSDFWYIMPFKSFSPFCAKNGPKLTCGHVFQDNFLSEANLKNPEQGFFRSHILLAKETKRMSLAGLVFNLKAIEFGAFFAYVHLFRHLKEIQLFQKYVKTFCFWQAFRHKKPFEDCPSGFKIRF